GKNPKLRESVAVAALEPVAARDATCSAERPPIEIQARIDALARVEVHDPAHADVWGGVAARSVVLVVVELAPRGRRSQANEITSHDLMRQTRIHEAGVTS